MERLSDKATTILNELHTERLDYNSEYLPLIDAINQLSTYEDTGLTPEEVKDMTENTETRLLTWFEAKYGFPVGILMDLCEAKQQGKIVVQPCKPEENWKDENGNIITIESLSYTHSRNHIRTVDVVICKYEDNEDDYAVNWTYFKSHFTRVK